MTTSTRTEVSRGWATFLSPIPGVGSRTTEKALEIKYSDGSVEYACVWEGCEYRNVKLRSVFSHRVAKHIREYPRDTESRQASTQPAPVRATRGTRLPRELTSQVNKLVSDAVETRAAQLSQNRTSDLQNQVNTWRKRALEAERKLSAFRRALQ